MGHDLKYDYLNNACYHNSDWPEYVNCKERIDEEKTTTEKTSSSRNDKR